jgi:hypothetical protein
MLARASLLFALTLAPALALAACGNSHGTGGTSSTSGTGGATGSGAGGTGGDTGPCTEAWLCTPWETNGDDAATRACADTHKCGTTDLKPAEAATLPKLDLDYFKCNVQPVFDQKCSMLGCHGTEQGRALRIYSRGRKRLAGQTLANPSCAAGSTPSDGCDGANHCLCAAPHTDAEWRKNFDAARGFALDEQGKPFAAANMDKSELVAQPVVGGKAHAGIHLFNKGDAQYAALKSWLTGAKLGMACATGAN